MVALIVAMSLTLMVMLAALVVDIGHARDVRREAQNASDASALAAGNALYNDSVSPRYTQAVQAAKDYAAENYGITAGEWASCTDPDPLRRADASTQCISFQNSADATKDVTKPDTVRVRIPTRDVVFSFGGLAGIDSTDVAAEAEIGVRLESVPQCALCVIGPGPHDLQNGDATVSGGNIHFNGSVSVSNNGLVATTGTITVEGTASGSYANYTPDPLTNQPPIEDPLGFMTMPATSGLSVKTDPCTQGPGKYGSVNLRNRTCNLQPGLYVIGGIASVWDMAGNSSTLIQGSGVTLYFTCGTVAVPAVCSTGQTGATLDASGNGRLNIQAPTSGPLQGLALVYDRNNSATFRMTGNGGSGFRGTIYAPSAKLQMNGNGCAATFEALIVVGTIEMNGSPSCLRSAYARSNNVDLPADQLHLTK